MDTSPTLDDIRKLIGTPIHQGKCVVEAQTEGDWLIMFPDGSITSAQTKKAAVRACRKWFKENLKEQKKAAIGLIEWRT